MILKKYHLVLLLLLELGTGWAPAVADDDAELKLIQEQERVSTDDRDYWIGGLAYDQVQNEGNFFVNFLVDTCPFWGH